VSNETVLCFDIEADNLMPLSSRVWVVGARLFSLDEPINNEDATFLFYENDKTSFESFLGASEPSIIVGHNIIGFDLPCLRQVWGVDFSVGARGDSLYGLPVTFVDTLLLSQFLDPDRLGGHSLEAWGERLGYPKMNFRKELIEAGGIPPDAPPGAEFNQHHPLMDTYCTRDVEVTERVYRKLLKEACRDGE